jgi:hypothetical protein
MQKIKTTEMKTLNQAGFKFFYAPYFRATRRCTRPPGVPEMDPKNSCDRSVMEFQQAPEAFEGLDLAGGAADPVCCYRE